MLIFIVVAATLIIYVYSSGLLGSLQGVQPQQGQYTNQITLEFYDWTSLGTLKLTLRNTGSGLGVFAAFYVNGTAVNPKTGSTCWAVSATVGTITTLKPHSSCTVYLDTSTAGLTISAGLAYRVRIATRDGGVFSYSCIAGQSTASLS